MFSTKELEEKLNISWIEIVKPEIVVLGFIQNYWEKQSEDERKPITFSQLLKALKNQLGYCEIKKSLDILIDTAFIVPEDSCVTLKFNEKEEECFVRAYRPTEKGKLEQILLNRLAYLIEHEEIPQTNNENLIKREEVSFEFISEKDVAVFTQTIIILNYIYYLVKEKIKYIEPWIKVSKTFLYKLVGNVTNIILPEAKDKIALKIVTAQYGRIPVFSKKNILKQDYHIRYVMDKMGEWNFEEDGVSCRKNREEISKDINFTDPELIGKVGHLTKVFLDLNEKYINYGKIYKYPKGPPTKILNALITCPNPEALSESCEFEFSAYKKWVTLFLDVIDLWLIINESKNYNLDKIINNLGNHISRAKSFPYYKKSEGEIYIPEISDFDKKNPFIMIESSFKRIKKERRKTKKEPALFESKHEEEHEYLDNIKNCIKEFLENVLSQAWKAAEQLCLKVDYYVNEIPRIQHTLLELRESHPESIAEIQKILKIMRSRNDIGKRNFEKFLDKFSKILAPLTKDYIGIINYCYPEFNHPNLREANYFLKNTKEFKLRKSVLELANRHDISAQNLRDLFINYTQKLDKAINYLKQNQKLI